MEEKLGLVPALKNPKFQISEKLALVIATKAQLVRSVFVNGVLGLRVQNRVETGKNLKREPIVI